MKSGPPRRQTDMTSTDKPTGPRSYFPSIERTYGKPIDEWMQVLAGAGPRGHRELVTWLKSVHGLGHGHANALVAVHLNPSL
jgi:Domain of unknown function (DUF4287)